MVWKCKTASKEKEKTTTTAIFIYTLESSTSSGRQTGGGEKSWGFLFQAMLLILRIFLLLSLSFPHSLAQSLASSPFLSHLLHWSIQQRKIIIQLMSWRCVPFFTTGTPINENSLHQISAPGVSYWEYLGVCLCTHDTTKWLRARSSLPKGNQSFMWLPVD